MAIKLLLFNIEILKLFSLNGKLNKALEKEFIEPNPYFSSGSK